MKKQLYEQPMAEIFEVHLQANVLNTVSGEGSASNGFDPNNDLGGLGDEDGD